MRLLIILPFIFFNDISLLAQEITLYPEQANVPLRFGSSIAAKNNILVIGAGGGHPDFLSLAGAAYVFEQEEGTWIEKQLLSASDAANFDEFGYSLAMDENYIVIGAPKSSDTEGRVYIFSKNQEVWVEEAKLSAPGNEAGNGFGFSVDIVDGVIAIGVLNSIESDINSGVVYIYEKVDGIWSETQKVIPPEPLENGQFGYEVSISEDFLIITGSTDLEDYNFINGRSIHIYEKENGFWVLKQQINSIGFWEHLSLGNHIEIQADRLIINTFVELENENYEVGGVYIYRYEGGTWEEETLIIPTEMGPEDKSVRSFDIENDMLAMSVFDSDQNKRTCTIYLYTFDEEEEVWMKKGKINPSNGHSSDQFGRYGLEIDNDQLFTGAQGNDSLGAGVGAAYIYDLDILLDSNEPHISTQPLCIRPNPAGSMIEVSLELENPARIERLEIYDFNGRLVQNISGDELARREHQWSISTSAFLPGLYVLKGIGTDQIFTGRLLKVGAR